MRNMLSFLCVLGISCASFAQTGQSSWANLNGLNVGQKIQVVEMTAKKDSGTFLSVSDSAISFKDSGGEKSVQRTDLRSVKLMSNRRLRHTLIGTGVGAGAGAGICGAAWESHGFLGGKGTGAAVGAGLGGLSGLIIGVLLPAHDTTIYSAGSH
jgi:hypothetical protein